MDDESYFVAEDVEGDTSRELRFGRRGNKLMFVMGDATGTHGFRVNSTNGPRIHDLLWSTVRSAAEIASPELVSYSTQWSSPGAF